MSADLLKALGLGPTNSGTFLGNGEWSTTTGAGLLESVNPTTGKVIATVEATSDADYETIVARAQAAFMRAPSLPSPVRAMSQEL